MICALVLAAAVPHWISVMPLRDDWKEADVVSDAVELGERTVIDGIAFWCPVHPEGDPVADKAAHYARRFGALAPQIRKGSSVRTGILMQATMGHGGEPGSRTPWQLAVHADGKVTYRFCPLDPRFLDYIARTCRTLSAAKPDFFMVDDDTRLIWKKPGCFCPLHLAAFAERTGRAWTREEVVAKLDAGDREVTEKWLSLKAESLAGFFRTVRANYDPSIPGILCACGAEEHMRHAREYARILAAPGQVPMVRGNGAPYCDTTLEAITWLRSSYAAQRAFVGDGVDYLQESDTCPHTRWGASATALVNEMVMLALEGVKGAKVWITRSEPDEGRSRAAYRRAFRENRGLMAWAAKTDFRQRGFVIPQTVTNAYSVGVGSWGARYFSRAGIPYRIGAPAKGEVAALSGETVDNLTDAQLRELLSGLVLLDGTAAIRLTERGFAADIGVEAKPWTGRTVQRQEFADGRRLGRGLVAGSADLSRTAAGATVRSRLFNRPKLGADFEPIAPGSVLFTNARGGRVYSFAQALVELRPIYHASAMYSETYRDEVVKAGAELAGTIPGGAYYLGDEPMMFEIGETEADGTVFVLDNLELDADDAPEIAFAEPPVAIERLRASDGSWQPVRFTCGSNGVCRLETVVRTEEPAVFRMRITGAAAVLTAGNVEIVADTTTEFSKGGEVSVKTFAFAAEELSTLLGEVFGEKVAVVAKPSGTRKRISLEFDPSFARDQIRIVSDAEGVRIVNGEALRYGVYEFLERYAGCRFYFPGPLGTIVPKRRTLEVPEGTYETKPSYVLRGTDENWCVNGAWYGDDCETAGPVEARRKHDQTVARMRLAPRNLCCHGLEMKFHIAERYGKTHPEYFALMKDDDGSFYRDDANSKWKGHHGQLCHTSRVWEDVIYPETKALMAAGTKTVDVSAQDGMQKCWCTNCLAAYNEGPSYARDLIWGRTRDLANRLAAEGYAGHLIQTAYGAYSDLPSFALPENVDVEVARNGPWSVGNEKLLAEDFAFVRKWAKRIGHGVQVWTYPGKFGRKMKNVDIPQMTPRAYGRFFAELSDAIVGSYAENRTDRWIYNYLNLYVYSKVSWDVKTDVDALLDEHYRLMFGAAADEMRAYYELLEDLWLRRVANNVVDTEEGPVIRELTEQQKWTEVYSPAMLERMKGYFDRALAKVAPGSLEAKRIEFIRLHFDAPLRRHATEYFGTYDVALNDRKRSARANRSLLLGTGYDEAKVYEADGEKRGSARYRLPFAGVKPRTAYTISFFTAQSNCVATAHNGGSVVAVSFDGGGNPHFPKPVYRVGSSAWRYWEFDYTTGDDVGDGSAAVVFGFEHGKGKAWFRGFRVEEKEGK